MEQKEFKTVTVDGDLYFNANEVHAHISKVEETARKDERERVIWEARAIVEARIEEITGGDRQYKKYWGINNDICNEISLALKGLDNNK